MARPRIRVGSLEWKVSRVLWNYGACTLADIAGLARLGRIQVFSTTLRLLRKGLVCVYSQRKRTYVLTASGRKELRRRGENPNVR